MQKMIKVVTLGDSDVGKDHLSLSFQGAKVDVNRPLQSTIGVDFKIATKEIDGEPIKFQIWIPSGNGSYRSLIPMYVRGSQIVFLIYDITSKTSFDHLNEWLGFLELENQNIKIFVIGNKVDLASDREVGSEEAEAFAKKIGAPHFEVSAQELTNMDKLIKAVEEKASSIINPKAEKSVDEQLPALTQVNEKIEALRTYAGVLAKLKDTEYFSEGAGKKAFAINKLLEFSLPKAKLESILKNEKDPLVKNRNIIGSGFFRIKSKILGHTNPLRDGRACQSDTEWKLVQIYNAMSESEEEADVSEDTSSSAKN